MGYWDPKISSGYWRSPEISSPEIRETKNGDNYDDDHDDSGSDCNDNDNNDDNYDDADKDYNDNDNNNYSLYNNYNLNNNDYDKNDINNLRDSNKTSLWWIVADVTKCNNYSLAIFGPSGLFTD